VSFSFSFEGAEESFSEVAAFNDHGADGGDDEAEGDDADDGVGHDEGAGEGVCGDDCRSAVE
jgi:hypothetical protein